jgi:hypothetical protein
MSAEQRIICAEADWLFLRATKEVDGWEELDTTNTYLGQYVGNYMRTSYSPNIVEMFAEKFTSDADYLMKFNYIILQMKIMQLGPTVPSGNMIVYVCEDKDGLPDMDNIVLTSETKTADQLALTTSYKGITFNFSNYNNTVLLKNRTYWLVIKWDGAADNGDGIIIGVDNRTRSSTTYFKNYPKIYGDSGYIWDQITTGRIVCQIFYTKCDYLHEIELDDDIDEVKSVWAGKVDSKTPNLNIYDTDQFLTSGDDLPVDTFCVKTATNNQLTLYINPSTENIKWYIEYIKKPTNFTNDTDTSVIPDSFIDRLIIRCAANFIARGIGTQSVDLANVYLARDSELKASMEQRYLSRPKSFRPLKSGYMNRTNLRDSFIR